MGEVDSVMAKTATRLVKIEAEDTGAAILKFRNGAIGIIEATTATRPKDLEGSISILGEKGSVEIGGFFMNELKIWNFTEPDEVDKEIWDKYGFQTVVRDIFFNSEVGELPFVSHKNGFIFETLKFAMEKVGFNNIYKIDNLPYSTFDCSKAAFKDNTGEMISVSLNVQAYK